MIKTVGSGFLVPEEAQHWPRARRFSSAISTRFHRRSRRTISDRSRVATYLASLAVRALIEEAELTPKPALVDERGPGAHTDLSLTLMKSSAHCLRPGFELMALASFRQIPGRTLREDLGTIGRRAERSMLLTTGGVNTHRGAIWTLSLRSTVIEESGLIGALQIWSSARTWQVGCVVIFAPTVSLRKPCHPEYSMSCYALHKKRSATRFVTVNRPSSS